MKKTEKLSILISIVLISLLAISAVSAAEADEPTLSETSTTNDVVSEPTNDVVSEPTTSDVQAKDTQDTTAVKSSNTKPVKAEPTTPGNFTELNDKIRSEFDSGKTTINLTKNYTYKTGDKVNTIELVSSAVGGTKITIDGKGNTIDGTGAANIFQIKNGMEVIIENLKLINVKDKLAAITVANDSSLTLINVTFQDNTAGAISNIGCKVTIDNSKFINNGPAIISTDDKLDKLAEEDAANSSFLDNVLKYSDLIITNSIFDGNTQTLNLNNSLVYIDNTTFKDDAKDVIFANNTILFISEDSLFNNTGSINLNNSATLINTAKFIKSSANAINAANSDITLICTEFINATKMAINAANSEIFIAESNFTNGKARAVVIDNSTLTVLNTNFNKPSSNTGAIIVNSGNNTVTVENSTFTGYANGIRVMEAVNSATLDITGTNFTNNTNGLNLYNTDVTIDAIFENSKGTAIDLTNGTLNIVEAYFINSNDAINAEDSDITIVYAEFNSTNDEAIYLNNGTLNIVYADFENTANEAIQAIYANITIDDAYFANNTGAIYLEEGRLDVNDAWFINNTDGAIFATGANVTIIGAYFEGNGNEEYDGGAIYLEDGELIITADSEFINNTAYFGGAIYIGNVNATIWADFINNTANQGGAIYIENSADEEVEIIGEFINNTATRAGAIRNTGNATIIGTFTNNTATARAGGAILNERTGNATITGTFTNNKATANGACGGAIYNYGGYATITGTFTNNTAGLNGGAISARTNDGNPTTIISNGIFTNNKANNGGAIENQGFMNISDSKFTKNNATGNGGAIYNTNTAEKAMLIKDTTFKNDYAPSIFDEDEWSESQAREIYTAHPTVDPEDHTISITLNGVTITNTFNNKEDYGYAPTIYCEGCVNKIDVKEYDVNVILNFTILNNVKDKVVLYITLVDEEGNLIDSAWKHIEWDDEFGEYQDKWVELPIFNITGDITTTNVNNSVPYITTLPIGQHTINITYGSDGGYGNPRFAFATETFTFNVTQTVENLTAQIADLEDQLQTAKDNATELAKQLAEAKDNATELAKQLAEAQGNATDLDKQLQAAKQQVANLTAQLNAANTELTTTKAALDNANNQINTLTITNNNLQSQLTAANNKADDANAKIKKVKAPKKVKKSKKLKITVTLSKKINGKYVYVIFNGKAYKAKAKKGVAKITIKKSALKKLGGKKIKYQIVYNQSIKNKTVKIKK